MQSRRAPHGVLLRLIDDAYAAAETPHLWDRFLTSLAESVNGRGAVLLQHDLMASGTISVGVRVDPSAVLLYDRHFNRLDPWAAPARELGPGVVATDEMLIPAGDLRRTEYFNDFGVKCDATRLMTVVLERRRNVSSVLTVLRGDRDAPFEPHDRELVATIVPHVQRALQIHQRISAAEYERVVAIEALDAVSCGVFLVTADARVVLTNGRARTMLSADDGLSTERSRLVAADPRQTKRLRDLCAAVAAASGSFSRHPGGMLALRRRRSDDRPLHAMVVPTTSPEPLGLHDERVAAIVFVSDPNEIRGPSEAVLRQAFGLTPAESHVAVRIVVGKSLTEIAAERGSALETVRRQNKNILAKTGARHRSELVRLLSMMLPPSGR